MRTPLNAIIGFIELAKDADAEKTANYLASSDLAAKQLLSVINDVLDMSSIESGKMKIAYTSFNFSRMITSIANIYGTQCKQKNVDFEVIMETPTEEWFIGDELRINQILMNLLGNSILTVDDEPAEREYMSLVLTRMGIRYTSVCGGEEALAALQKSEAEKDLYNVCLVDWRMPGMNGVETTKRIREKYGKELVVIVVSAYDFQQAGETAVEAGANLFLSKPIFQSSLFDLFMTLTGGKIAKPKEEPQAWDFAGKRVLLAEDNVLNQIVAKGYLAKYNVAVELAVDGGKAVEMFAASPAGYYDAILMDIQMPVMDGYEAAKTIRSSKHPQAAAIPIIAQTADAFNEDISRALAAGMNAHVSKPVKPDVLAKALHKAFTETYGH